MTKASTSAFVAGLDSEDDGRGNPFLWCVCHDAGSWSGTSRGDTLQFLENMARDMKQRDRKFQVWATNLEYDLVNLFEPERIVECNLRFGRAALCGASWHGVEFRDTMRHLPISVAAFGDLVGLKKLEADLFEKRPVFPLTERQLAKYRRRCSRDAAITYRAARFFHSTYGELGGRPKMTLASTALSLWQDRYWCREIHRPDDDVWRAALCAYHGGRTQAFAVGDFERVRVVDAASMFPWAMCAGDLPLPWGLYTHAARGADLKPLALYRARVTSDMAFPVLPVRTDSGTQYPNGTWTDWYVGEELIAFRDHGGRVLVLEGFEFQERCRPFDKYVAEMFELKQSARGARRLLYKTLLNGLYGKFSQQGKRVHAVPIDRLLAMDDPPFDWRAWNGLAIYSTDHDPPPWSNHVWPAFVTARARIKLAGLIRSVAEHGGRPLYCDTDSLMFQGTQRFPKHARKIGDFELRGSYRTAVIVGKKEYALEVRKGKWKPYVKGVPFSERERYIREGVADFVRPVRIRESARIGVAANVWKRVHKERRTKLRGRKSDGRVSVPVIAPGKKRSDSYGRTRHGEKQGKRRAE